MAIPIVNSNIAAPKIPVSPSSISSILLRRTAFIFEEMRLILDPRAKMVEPASLSDILYLDKE